MFEGALRQVEAYTWPVVLSTCRTGGQVDASIGTFVIVNQDGWFLTAAHVVQAFKNAADDLQRKADYEAKLAAVGQMGISKGAKRREIRQLGSPNDWVVDHSIWWGRDGLSVSQPIEMNGLADIALGRLDKFDPAWVATYPIFKRVQGDLPTGAALCRLGFPFHEIKPSYDAAARMFTFPPGALPMPRFPNDGMLTRFVMLTGQLQGQSAKFIETSTPGLRGQSGGPVFDRSGYVWGLQSHTDHLNLGFSPEVTTKAGKLQEHQFLNVGRAAHVEELVKLMKAHNVAFALSP